MLLGYLSSAAAELIQRAAPVLVRGRSSLLPTDDRVLVADPTFGNRTMSVAWFEAAWIDAPEFGRAAFVVERADGAEPPDRLAPRPDEFVVR